MRNGFSFLRSYYEAAQELPAEDQAAFFMAVCKYALDGEEPEITGVAAALFKLAKPNIDASNKKADAGKTGGSRKQTASKTEANSKQTVSKTEANDKQTASKPQANSKQNAENDEKTVSDIGYRINDIGDRSKDIGEKEKDKKEKTDFETFWDEYPKRKGIGAAKKAFEKAITKTDIQTILEAVRKQKTGEQWKRDNGQFIPYPSTWLNQERWEDEPDVKPVDNSQRGESYNVANESYKKVLDILGVEDG